MAEIRIERRPPVWPWIVGILGLVLVAWLVIGTLGTDRDPVGDPVVAERPVEPAGEPGDRVVGTAGGTLEAVEEYAAFAEQAEVEPGEDHEYTAEGIRQLTAALAAHVNQNANDSRTRERLDRFRQMADRLQRDPGSEQHAGMTRDVFTSAVDVFESARVDAGDVSQLRATAEAVSPDRPLLDQIERVRQFFRQSAKILQSAAARS